jgi:hypothetical protein
LRLCVVTITRTVLPQANAYVVIRERDGGREFGEPVHQIITHPQSKRQ